MTTDKNRCERNAKLIKTVRKRKLHEIPNRDLKKKLRRLMKHEGTEDKRKKDLALEETSCLLRKTQLVMLQTVGLKWTQLRKIQHKPETDSNH